MKDLLGRDLVNVSIDRLKMFEPKEGYYLAFSGGKDSCVIKALADMSGVKYDAHYSVTTIDPPELVYFIRKHHKDVKWERPEKPFLKRMMERGFPTRKIRWCCAEFKETGGAGRIIVTGIRAAESHKRAGRKMLETCYKDKSKRFLNIIIDWSDDDVWEFIKTQKIRYCSLYDEGFKRLGCLFCPMSNKKLEQVARYPRMANSFRIAFNKLYNKNKEREAYKRWRTGDEMFNWWLHEERGGKVDADQTVMFE
jgi:phosphoadenosine phosphosulfate reductase